MLFKHVRKASGQSLTCPPTPFPSRFLALTPLFLFQLFIDSVASLSFLGEQFIKQHRAHLGSLTKWEKIAQGANGKAVPILSVTTPLAVTWNDHEVSVHFLVLKVLKNLPDILEMVICHR